MRPVFAVAAFTAFSVIQARTLHRRAGARLSDDRWQWGQPQQGDFHDQNRNNGQHQDEAAQTVTETVWQKITVAAADPPSHNMTRTETHTLTETQKLYVTVTTQVESVSSYSITAMETKLETVMQWETSTVMVTTTLHEEKTVTMTASTTPTTVERLRVSTITVTASPSTITAPAITVTASPRTITKLQTASCGGKDASAPLSSTSLVSTTNGTDTLTPGLTAAATATAASKDGSDTSLERAPNSTTKSSGDGSYAASLDLGGIVASPEGTPSKTTPPPAAKASSSSVAQAAITMASEVQLGHLLAA